MLQVPAPFLSYYYKYLTQTMSQIFIGKCIEDELRRQERSVVWLARKLNCNRTNVYKIFHRASVDSELLLKISNVLKVNFFQQYIDHLDP